ncbi:MAG: hypothetical protein JXB15_09635 [Anaerolineales bacterium]|nr:hypothetical protein [Anaerolineales bacterium]
MLLKKLLALKGLTCNPKGSSLLPFGFSFNLRIIFILAVLAVPLSTGDTAPPPIYVDYTAAGLNNGSSWANAYIDLQAALAVASPGDQIWVAQGSYMPGTLASDTFQLLSEVSLYGGFPSGGSAFSLRDWNLYPTILSGDVGISGLSTDNCYHVVTGSGTDDLALLDGFIISDGQHLTDTCPGSGCGAGLYNLSGQLTIRNVIFRNNHAKHGGGMADLDGSGATLENVIFERNTAISNGGGLYARNSQATLVGVSFWGNTAHSGGGVYNFDSDTTLVNVIFSGNQASARGGGLYNDDSLPTMANMIFASNYAGLMGGGMQNNLSDVLLENTIFWGNTSGGTAPQIGVNTASPTADYCLVEGGCPSGVACTNLLTSDPQFIGAPDPGLDAIWATSDDNYGDLRPRRTAPTVDAGDNSAVPVVVVNDRMGNPRFVDDSTIVDSGAGLSPIIDIGAFEKPPATIYVDLNAGGADDGTSWVDAFIDLQSALYWAQSGATKVWVAQGTYKPGGARVNTFQLLSGVEIYGGFPTGGGDGTFKARNWESYPVTLSGDIGILADISDNSYHVVDASYTDNTAILDGFSIRNGNADGAEYRYYYGGGIYNWGGDAKWFSRLEYQL